MRFVVAIAVAGRGLESLIRLLEDVPASINMSFIVVAPLLRDRESLLDQVIKPHCILPVRKVIQPMLILPGYVYVIAEDTWLTIEGSYLIPVRRSSLDRINTAIDTLFIALAKNFKEKAIAIVLDGMGNGGVKGSQEIEKNGGYVITHIPGHDRNSEMPKAVIVNDHPNKVIPVEQMIPHLLEMGGISDGR